MASLSIWRLVRKRSVSDWKLLVTIVLGMLLATIVLSSTPIYLGALEKMGVLRAIDEQPEIITDIDVFLTFVPLERSQLDKTEAIVAEGIQNHIPELAIGKARYLFGPTLPLVFPGQIIPPGGRANTGLFQSMDGLESHVRFLKGRMAGDEVAQLEKGPQIEAAISTIGAELFGLDVGEVIRFFPGGEESQGVSVSITGILEPSDPSDRYWHGNAGFMMSPIAASDQDDPPVALLVTEEALVEGVGNAYPGTTVSSLWFIYAEREVIKESPISLTLTNLEEFEGALTRAASRSVVVTGTTELLEDFQNRLFFSRIPLLLLVALMLATVLYYLAMMASYLVQRRQEELSLLRTRGTGRLQLLRFYSLEGLLLTGFAVIISPFIALGLVALLGKLPFFQDFSGGQLLPVKMNIMPFLASLGGGILSLIILLVPLVVGYRSGLLAQKQLAARPPQSPFFQRYHLDIGLLIIGGLIFWELSARGTLVSGGLFGSRAVNEALLFGPILFLIAVTLIFLRVFPPLARLLSRALSRIVPAWVALGLWHMSRNPLQYSWLILLLVMVTGLGTLATTMGGTLETSYRQRVLYDTATDIRVEGVPGAQNIGVAFLKEQYAGVPGVASYSLAYRGMGQLGTTLKGSSFDILALETRDFPHMAWYRDDFSRSSLGEIMQTLQAESFTPPRTIPQGATRIGVWVKPDAKYTSIFLWVIVKDSRGRNYTITAGSLGDKEWHPLEAELPAGAVRPLTLAALQIYEPVYGAEGTPGHVYLDSVYVTSPSQPEPIEVEGFEGLRSWLPQVTSVLATDNLSLAQDEAHDGRASALFRFGKTTERGVRGIYHNPGGGPLPVVTSTSFLAKHDMKVGDSAIISFLGRLISVDIRDSVEYFPTLDPGGGGFVLADLDLLMGYANLLPLYTAASPNEVFLSAIPGAQGTAVRNLQATVRGDKIHDRMAELESILADPLVTAGWKGMEFISLGIIAVTAILGYLTYLLSFAFRSRGEMVFLQAIGFSRRQLLGLLGLEHLVVVIIGLGLGSWSGLRMSNLVVSSLSHTETGTSVLPPLILVTQWGFMALIYAILLLVVMGTLLILNRAISRLDLQTISRLEA